MHKRSLVVSSLAALILFFANCSKNNNTIINSSSFKALPLLVPAPADNPITDSKIVLGKLLFWDPILSGTKEVACATCHHASLGFTDNLDLSIGVNGSGLGSNRHFLANNLYPFTKRNCQTIINTAYNGINENGTCDAASAAMFFDLRTKSLELQSLEPIKTIEEMKGNKIPSTEILDTVIARITKVPLYAQMFKTAFENNNAVTIQNLGKAIATYERTIVSNKSPYDNYIRGDQSALSNAQINGMKVFQETGCLNCHKGPMFSDYELHVISAPDNPKQATDGGVNYTYQFRTASLRNLAHTAPYMHSGVFKSLDEVLDFYDRVGNRRSQNPHVSSNQLDSKLQHITVQDKNNIIQFLNSLNDVSFDKSIPTSVPSGLKVGGN